MAKDGNVIIAGEITTKANLDFKKIARDVIREIGYTDNNDLFSADNVVITELISKQSADIALGVDASLESKENNSDEENGAGDQGLMFGYACDETEELMPAPISYAHKLARKLTEVRKNGTLCYLKPDGKSQVTFRYEGSKPVAIDTIVVSTQHYDVDMEMLRDDIMNHVIKEVIPESLIDENTKYYINPTGRFVIGGPEGDCGLTGRKIIVDTYGGYAPHGGGAFSGKDPTKVDRSAAYMARYIAKNVVASGIARSCLVQVAYAIGVASPVSVSVDTNGTSLYPDDKISEAINDIFDLRPTSIINKLELRKPIYSNLAANGHIGRDDLNVSFEKTDMASAIKEWFSVNR